jgi:hypothetical protein
MGARSAGSAWLLAAGALTLSTAAAHHSTAFYAPETIELEGELVRVDWVNPHVRLVLETTERGGGAKRWQMESSSISTLERRGVTRELFRVGDRISVAGHVSTRDASGFQLTNVLLPDGREASLWLDSAPYFTAAAAMIRRGDELVDAASENRGIFRVWSVPRVPAVTPDEISNQPFMVAAVAARAAFDLNDNFATRCGPEGMPRVMWSPLPWKFEDRGATIVLRGEIYDTERTIHMASAAMPPDTPASILGWSVGHWENGALVVTTTNVSWPYFDNIGTPQSADVRIVERFSLAADQTRLDFHATVTDPKTLTAPAVVDGHWLALGAELPRFDCQAPR